MPLFRLHCHWRHHRRRRHDDFFVLEAPDGVNTIAVTRNSMVRQYRFAPRTAVSCAGRALENAAAELAGIFKTMPQPSLPGPTVPKTAASLTAPQLRNIRRK
jgi:hypothetical protein